MLYIQVLYTITFKDTLVYTFVLWKTENEIFYWTLMLYVVITDTFTQKWTLLF